MSRSLINFRSEQIALGICSDRIGVVRQKSGWQNRKQTPEQGVIDVPQDAVADGWQPALDIVERWIGEYKIRNASATLTLSNRFARFALVPWSVQVKRSDEEASLARARFENQYGDMTGWTIQLDTGRYGAARIACAIETKFIEHLRSLFSTQRIVCPVVQPYFVTGWNRWHRQFGKTANALFACAESQVVVMAARKAGQWHSVRAVHGKDNAQSLQVLLEREVLLQGFAEMPQIRIHAPSLRSTDTAVWPQQMRLLGSDVTVSEAALAMALSGVGA